MDLKVCNELYVRPYKYYPTGEIDVHELRYQVIFDGTAAGNKQILAPLESGLESEEAAIEYCSSLMQEPQWKHNLEVRIISERLRGYTAWYQLNHFDRLFANWSEHEKDLARKILTGELDNKRDRRDGFSNKADSLDAVICSCEEASKEAPPGSRNAKAIENDVR